MTLKTLASGIVLSAVLVSISPGLASPRQTRLIELATKDPTSKAAIFRVNAQSLMLESSEGGVSTLFMDEGIFTINNKDKTYRFQSYADLQANASRKAAELAQTPEPEGRAQGVEFELTDQTETISGFSARKLIRTHNGEPDAEFWVSSELLPQCVRKLGESLRTSIPQNYWAQVRSPGMVELVVLFGVPLRFTHDHQIYQSRIIESPESSLQVPTGYRKLDK